MYPFSAGVDPGTGRGAYDVQDRTAFIKQTMLREKAAFAAEMSGHFFFADRWYGFDDACYAAGRLLEMLSKVLDPKAIWAKLPWHVHTPEIHIPVEEEEKFDLMARFVQGADFPNADRITIDGLRVEWPDGWGLVRASNTTPCLIARFEANSEVVLKEIQQAFRDQLQRYSAELSIPF